MTLTRNVKDQRIFTISLRSKGEVKNVTLDENENVFIEGSLGTFQRAQFVDDVVLEVIGSNGELRVDLAASDLHLRPNQAEDSKKDRGSRQ